VTAVFVLATGNADKAREIGEILGDAAGGPVEVAPVAVGGRTAAYVLAPHGEMREVVGRLTVPDAPPSVEETGETIEENARIKAAGWSGALDLPAIADDTGLEVDALGGEPGVHSARYAGEAATYAENVAKLLAAMDGVGAGRRACRFVTVALARFPDGREVMARGTVEGSVAEAPRGVSGFGYDAVFVPDEGDGRTFGEMSAAEKHAVSHRGRALRDLAVSLGAGLGAGV
jgi:XTP/dITP diphosphohydrolase